MRFHVVGFAWGILWNLPAAASAQAVLMGRVREDSTGRVLQGVEVMVDGTRFRGATDARGNYVIHGLPAGRRVVLMRLVGYRPVRTEVLLQGADTVIANALLMRGEVRLDPVEVTATMPTPRGLGLEGLEERRRLGFGKFIDEADLRGNEHLRVSDLIGRMPGLHLLRLPPHLGNKKVAVSARRAGRYECPMQVVVDGVILYRSHSPTVPWDPEKVVDLDDWMPADLSGVEVYRGSAEVPPEYGGAGGGCGVVVLWTRRPGTARIETPP